LTQTIRQDAERITPNSRDNPSLRPVRVLWHHGLRTGRKLRVHRIVRLTQYLTSRKGVFRSF